MHRDLDRPGHCGRVSLLPEAQDFGNETAFLIASSHLAAVAYRKSCGLPNIYRISSGKMLTKTGMATCFGVDLAHEVRKRERTDFLPS